MQNDFYKNDQGENIVETRNLYISSQMFCSHITWIKDQVVAA